MNQLLRANVRQHGGRYLATVVAIALSTTFLMLCMVAGGGLQASVRRIVAADIEGAQVVAGPDSPGAGEDVQKSLQTLAERVRAEYPQLAVEVSHANGTTVKNGDKGTLPAAVKILDNPAFYPKHVVKGQLPTQKNQVALDSGAAKTMKVKLGDTITLVTPRTFNSSGDIVDRGVDKPFTVSGLVDSSIGMFSVVFVPKEGGKPWMEGASAGNVLITSKGAMSETKLAADVKKVLEKQAAADQVSKQASDQVLVLTAAEYTNKALNKDSGQTQTMVMLLIFPALAMVTTIIVISTTFSVMFTQRRRELALLRLVGATKRQTRSLVLRETLLVGFFASLLGAALGAGIGIVLSKLAGLTLDYAEAASTIAWWMPVITVAAGVIMTLLAGMGPARAVGRVTPMAALDTNESAATVTKRRTVRTVFGTIFLLVGLAGMWLGTHTVAGAYHGEDIDESRLLMGFLTALGSGFVTFIALLILCTVILPYLTYAVGKILAGRRVDWQLAAENTRRNPARTGATATALILGITLVTTMLVGTESSKATIGLAMDRHAPVDITLNKEVMGERSEAAFSPAEVDTVRRTKGVKAVQVVQTVLVDTSTDGKGQGATDMSKWDPGLKNVINGQVPDVQPGQVATKYAAPGAKYYYVGPVEGKLEKLQIVKTDLDQSLLAPADFDHFAQGQEVVPDRIWLKLDDNHNMSEILATVERLSKALPDVSINGSAPDRAQIYKMIDIINWAAIALLAVSIVVALVGVGNTLALSVLERRRENAMLRALGMRRGRIRNMLTVEALLIGLLATAVGLAAGIFFGWVGMHALPLGKNTQIILSVPWLYLGGCALVAIGAAVAASIVPARRAAKIPPVQALAGAE